MMLEKVDHERSTTASTHVDALVLANRPPDSPLVGRGLVRTGRVDFPQTGGVGVITASGMDRSKRIGSTAHMKRTVGRRGEEVRDVVVPHPIRLRAR